MANRSSVVESEKNCRSTATGQWTAKRKNENEKFQTIEGDWMVGPLGKIASSFWPTSRKRGGDRTTTLRRRVVGAATPPPTIVAYVVASMDNALYDN